MQPSSACRLRVGTHPWGDASSAAQVRLSISVLYVKGGWCKVQGQYDPPKVSRHGVMLQWDFALTVLVSLCCLFTYPQILFSNTQCPTFLHFLQFGDRGKLLMVRFLNSTVMLRVGGGWTTLEEFLDSNDPCRGTIIVWDVCVSSCGLRNHLFK